MANTNMTNVLTSTAPVVKSFPVGITTNICSAAVTTSLALNDTLTGPSIPAGAYLVDVLLMSTDIDSNGSPTVTLDVGISGAATKFIAASTVGQTGGIAHMGGTTGLGYTPAADTPVIVTVSAAGATKVAGTITLAILYTNSP
jgi:hypothetical protein